MGSSFLPSPHPSHFHFSLLILTLFAFQLASASSSSSSSSSSFSSSSETGGWIGDRKSLVGPGSSPPTCLAKCGRCGPCEPVHVPIQPGLSLPLEYYPEAWRCKCGNKLFMP
ncbi:hypothetical protein IC575_013235 [Cucumis melo]|uniref:Epidermal patterning factor-like protein n=2 Tax=Cucumis melo TaxID=3656 RepID=A0A1S3AWH2_CUCME|nr:EPIDERMAL PATTERNING FACTOR-like protein 4 [Cucumis melo]